MTTTPTITAIREALRSKFGAGQYRIHAIGTIDVHGVMPNTNDTGWYLYGHIGAVETLHSLGLVK